MSWQLLDRWLDPAHQKEGFASLALVATLLVIVALVLHALATRRSREQPLGMISRLIHWGMMVLAVGLAASASFGVYGQGPLAGWPLLSHVVLAGGFVVGLPLLAVALIRRDRHRPVGILRGRVFTWLVLMTGLLTALTMLVSMTPWAGTERQEELLVIHRYSGLATFLGLVLHGYASGGPSRT